MDLCISRDILMKRGRAAIGLAVVLAVIVGTSVSYGQKGAGGGGGGGNSPSGGGGGGGQGGQAGSPQGGGASNTASPSSRIEASMLAYEASDRIAAHIADQVRGHKIYIYDSQTFAGIQSYEAYVATVSAFEMSFGLFAGGTKPESSFVTTAPVVQSLLTALRSTAEYAGETVNLQTDPVIAQVAHHLGGDNVIVPKFLLGPADDLQASSVMTLRATIRSSATEIIAIPPCADITRNVPDQIGCLLLVRNEAATRVNSVGTDSEKAAFADVDKLFQVFFGTLMGTSVNLSSATGTQSGGGVPAGGAPGGVGAGGGGNQTSPGPSGTNPTGNQSVSVPLLSQIIQGHRLKARFSEQVNKDASCRILVLEPTEAGGGSRIKHIFLVELFWTTPTPTFTGGSIVTYLLINPISSLVEKSEVLRFTVDYGKFHGKKIQTPSNF